MRSSDPEARLAERALREPWPVPPEKRVGLVQILVDLAESEAVKPRERIAAVKALLGASRLNLEAMKASMVAAEFELLTGRLAALGVASGPAGSAADEEGDPDG